MRLQRGNFFLVGMMGAGKTSRGRRLAAQLDIPFLDCDQELERRLERAIADIFEKDGEDFFRDCEEALLKELVRREGIVLSTGGGAVLRAANRQALRDNGTVIYLHARPEKLVRRLRSSTHRPLLRADDDLPARLHALYEARDALYRQTAHCVVESTSNVVIRLLQMIEQETQPDKEEMRDEPDFHHDAER